jgi:hypothetical protein
LSGLTYQGTSGGREVSEGPTGHPRATARPAGYSTLPRMITEGFKHVLFSPTSSFVADPLCSLQGPLGANYQGPLLPSLLCETRKGRTPPPPSRCFLMIICIKSAILWVTSWGQAQTPGPTSPWPCSAGPATRAPPLEVNIGGQLHNDLRVSNAVGDQILLLYACLYLYTY